MRYADFFFGDIYLLGGYFHPRDVYPIVYTEIFCAVLPSTIILTDCQKVMFIHLTLKCFIHSTIACHLRLLLCGKQVM